MKKYFTIFLLILFGSYSDLQAQWTAISGYPAGPAYSTVSFVIDDIAYAGGGNPSLKSFYSYDPTGDSWSSLSDIEGGFNRASPIGFVINGKGYVGGGGDMGSGVTNTFYEYDPANDSWTQKANFSGGNQHSGFYRAAAGKGYVIAGNNGSGLVADVWEYDPSGDSWTQKASYPAGAAYWPAGFVMNDKIYVGTGTIGGNGDNSFYEYDPSTDTWTQKADFPGSSRFGAVGFAFSDKGYIGGGGAPTFTASFTDFYAYDPVNDSWSQVSSLEYPNGSTAWSTAFTIGRDVYMGTGTSLAAGIVPTAQYFVAKDVGPLDNTGLAEGDDESAVHVFPNPANDLVNVNINDLSQSATFEVIDVYGRKVKQGSSLQSQFVIELKELSMGLYFIQIAADNTSYVHPVVLE